MHLVGNGNEIFEGLRASPLNKVLFGLICNGIWFALRLEIKPRIYKESARR